MKVEGWFGWIRWFNSTSTLLTLYYILCIHFSGFVFFKYILWFSFYIFMFVACSNEIYIYLLSLYVYFCCTVLCTSNLFKAHIIAHSIHFNQNSMIIHCNSIQFNHHLRFTKDNLLHSNSHPPSINWEWAVNLWSDDGIVNNYCQKLDLIRKA